MQNQVISRGNDIQTYTIGEGLEFGEKQMSFFLDKQYEAAKFELQGLFTTKEVWLIIHSLNGFPYSPELSAKFLLNEFVEDYIRHDYAEEYLDAECSLLLNKLNILTEFQAYTVLKMVSEFLEIDLDEELDQDSEELLNEIFVVSYRESVMGGDESCSEEISDCEKDFQNFELSWKFGFEKLHHIGTILALKFGIFIAVKFDDGEFTLYEDCQNCGELHFLESYTIDELMELDVMEEAKAVIEENFLDED
jgi:hypothetical protein